MAHVQHSQLVKTPNRVSFVAFFERIQDLEYLKVHHELIVSVYLIFVHTLATGLSLRC